MLHKSWWTGQCTYCLTGISGEQTPKTDQPGGPVNMAWEHDTPPADPDHPVVPRGLAIQVRLQLATCLGVTEVVKVRQDALNLGEVFIGPDKETVYRVTMPCGPGALAGWLRVQNVALDGVACPACHKYENRMCEECAGTGQAGGGIFAFSEMAEPTMWRVVATV